MSQGQDLHIRKTKHTKHIFVSSIRCCSRTLQSCPRSVTVVPVAALVSMGWGGGGDFQPAPHAHAVLGMDRVTGAHQRLAGAATSGRPRPGPSQSNLGYLRAPGPTGRPRMPRGCCSAHSICTPTFPLCEVTEEEGLCRHLLGWGANTQLGFFLGPRNCGCLSKSTDISHLQAELCACL